MKRRTTWTGLLILLALTLAACGGAPGSPGSGPEPTGYTVSGFVEDFTTRGPVAGAKVVLGEQTATTDEEGYWEFANVEGTNVVTVALEGGAVCPLNITVNGASRRNMFTAHDGDDGPAKMAGAGVYGNPYVIQTVEQLQAINQDLDAHYMLCDHIDASGAEALNGGKGFAPIGVLDPNLDPYQDNVGFTGILDGRHYEIRNLTIDRSDAIVAGEHADFVGLFLVIGEYGRIVDLRLAGGSVRGDWHVGALAGLNFGDISGVFNDGMDVSGDEFIGGLVGLNAGIMDNVGNRGAIEGTSSVGGIAGENEVDAGIAGAYNEGEVVGQAGEYSVGGIAGTNGGLVQFSRNSGPVTGDRRVGGVVGENDEEGIVRDSYNTHSVTGRSEVGGVVGYNNWEPGYPSIVERTYNTGTVRGDESVGGVVGYDRNMTTHSFNTGAVHGTGQYVGGVVGYKDGGEPLEHSYNTGSVQGGSHVGGVLGYLDDANMTYTFNVGNVAGDPDIGGLVGTKVGGNVEHSYFRNDGDNAGPNNGLGEGRTTVQLKQSGTYAGWVDFGNVWTIADGMDYPDLLDNPRR